MNKSKWKSIINFCVVLLIGIAIGYTAAHCQYGRCFSYFWGKKSYESKEAFLLSMFTRRLDLTEEQQGKVKAILAAQGKKLSSLSDEFKPQFKVIRNETDQQIRALLVGDQIEKFKALQERMKEYRKKRKGWHRR